MIEHGDVAETRAAYDVVAEDYAELVGREVREGSLDRAMLAAFADLVVRNGGGRVADLGCGTGRVTAHLAALGLDVVGIDLSSGMLAVARQDHPGLRFVEGSLVALDLADGSLGGAALWYSIIHTPPERLPEVFSELRRVLAPGGHVLVAFQVGDELRRVHRPYGHGVPLHAYRVPVERVAGLLAEAGIAVHARLVRGPEGEEMSPQAVLLARA